MKRTHFEAFSPICPVCRRNGRSSPLEIGTVFREDSADIIEGILLCPDPGCQSEFPVIDGIPIILADLRSYVSHSCLSISGRIDLCPEMEGLIGECCGPESAFDIQRRNLGTYAFDHYGDLDPFETGKEPAMPGSILALAREGLSRIPSVKGSVIDMGCAVGRTSFELAGKCGGLVLGIDLGFAMVKTASSVLREKRVRYPRRRMGMVYDRREFPVEFANAEKVDFWVCDASDLPFSGNNFSLAASLNLIDCISSPYAHLQEIARVLEPGGTLFLSTPYDWSSSATPVESWIGGHSSRSEMKGDGGVILEKILTPGAHPSSIEGFRICFSSESFPWSVRVHDRGVMEYAVQILIAEYGTENQNQNTDESSCSQTD